MIKLLFKMSALVVMLFLMNMPAFARLNIVTLIYPQYDVVKHIVKDKADVAMLLKPGMEVHTFEPVPGDIEKILGCDLFIYTGSEHDEWVEELLSSQGKKVKTLILTETMPKLYEEEMVEGMTAEEVEDEDESNSSRGPEFDEHIWTSPRRDIQMIELFCEKLAALDPENAEFFRANARDYAARFTALDKDLRDLIGKSERKTIIMADRFPFLYLAKDYGLDYFAAFKGCAAESEASASTVAFLISKTRELKVPAVLTVEFSNEKIGRTIAAETGVKVLTLNSCHNVSPEQFKSQLSMAELMRANLEVLKEVLN
ncbi:MAG: zinc ABC transporter substrate-binding protein [Succinivibrio sp.]|nr:zinc ABC transporter substrate-binding protein [Succinivibrio sp.]